MFFFPTSVLFQYSCVLWTFLHVYKILGHNQNTTENSFPSVSSNLHLHHDNDDNKIANISLSELSVPSIVNTRNALIEDTSIESSSSNANSNTIICPNMMHYVFKDSMPRNELHAGTFKRYPQTNATNAYVNYDKDIDLKTCVEGCCEMNKINNNKCNVVFIFNGKCYHVQCITNEGCLPKKRHSTLSQSPQMVLVEPLASKFNGNDGNGGQIEHSNSIIQENMSWMDILKNSKIPINEIIPLDELTNTDHTNSLNFWKQSHKIQYLSIPSAGVSNYQNDLYDTTVVDNIGGKRVNQLLKANANDDGLPEDLLYYRDSVIMPCNIEVTTTNPDTGSHCSINEECIAVRGVHSVTGICKCLPGFIRNPLNVCILETSEYGIFDERNHSAKLNEKILLADQSVKKSDNKILPVDKKLTVSVISKEVRLPEQEVTLAAFTVPDEQSSNTKYKYLWTLINQPKSPMNGTISDQSQPKVKLSNLSEGLYTFKVTVTGDNGTYGEATANVTVLPEKRINRVPQVIITPKEQTIRQPTTNAVLDGSTSTDDDKIVSWHWEVVSGPIGYQPNLSDVNTLQLTDLMAPGNYTFKLTVTDTDNVTNSTIANITVLKGTDYPPVANAGDAVILYLPNNNVTLNGTASSDDHEIVAWEWTKDAGDEAKAVDMQNTRTPYVQLSDLEEGMYTFVLKVTDGSGQSSTAKVHVFVKPPSNSPPIANAGNNMTINLPTNWIIINGSASRDNIAIKTYKWSQVIGPNNALILKSNETIANATGLTLGLYKFQLEITDGSNNTANDYTWVNVIQEKNSPPIANAGGDLSVILPVTAIYLNGTKSTDDLGISSYQWTREDSSLAAGCIVGNSDKEPVMILTNLVSGRYAFKLTVTDKQGLTSSDTISIFVHPDPLLLNLVQLILPANISMLTQSSLSVIVQKIAFLMGDMKIKIRELQHDSRSGAAVLVFYVEVKKESKTVPMPGPVIESLLKGRLQRDANILGTVFADVRTVICQNLCSGHGVCNTITRSCICEAFWMPSFQYFWGTSEANCDWSVLYVFVAFIVSLLVLSGIFWAIAMTCRQSKKPRMRPNLQKYSLVGNQDEEAQNYCRSTTLTDSDTDSDVLFESRTKTNGIMRVNGSLRTKTHNNRENHQKLTQSHSRNIKT